MPCNCGNRAQTLVEKLGFCKEAEAWVFKTESGDIRLDAAKLQKHHFTGSLKALAIRVFLGKPKNC